jgi:hypothetical protein
MSLILMVLFMLGVVTTAPAQPVQTFADLPLRLDLGDRVIVERRTLGPVSGRVVRLTREEIVVEGEAAVVVARADVSRVRVRGDSLSSGARIGALVGGAIGCGVLGVFSGEARGGDCVQGLLFLGALGAGVGLAVDALHTGTTTVFTAPDGPTAHRRGGAAGVALRATVTW